MATTLAITREVRAIEKRLSKIGRHLKLRKKKSGGKAKRSAKKRRG